LACLLPSNHNGVSLTQNRVKPGAWIATIA
jgi:hypothetical protein